MIVFCHGLESEPHGRKYHALVQGGLHVVAPDCRGKGLRERVDIIASAIAEHRPRVLVGSSFGGIAGLLAALVAAARGGIELKGLLLCAPALHLPDPPDLGITRRCPAPTTIIHGTRDDVIPIDVSRAFARDHGARLIEVDDEHALPHSLDLIVSTTRALSES
jgi:pimeloyl-ACP methyl ester carboxylesterase